MGGPDRVGHGVVDVGHFGRPVTAGEPAGQIAAADEVGQRRRGSVVRLRAQLRTARDGPQLRPAREVGHQLGRHRAVAGKQPGLLRAVAGHALGLGHQVDDDLAGVGAAVLPGGAVGRTAGAGQCRRARRQCPDGVGAPLSRGARVIAADHRRQLVEPAIQRRGVRGADRTPELRDPVPRRAHLHVAIRIRGALGAHSVGIGLSHMPIHDLGDLVSRQPIPARGVAGQPLVDGGHDVVVGDQAGAEHHCGDDAEVDLAGGEHRGQPG